MAERTAQLRRLHHFAERIGEFPGIVRWKKYGRAASDLAKRCDIARDHWTTASHRFNNRQSESFINRRLKQGARSLDQNDNIFSFDCFEPDNTICHVETLGQPNESIARLPPLQENEPPGTSNRCGESRDRQSMTFAWSVRPDEQKVRRCVSGKQSGLLPRRVYIFQRAKIFVGGLPDYSHAGRRLGGERTNTISGRLRRRDQASRLSNRPPDRLLIIFALHDALDSLEMQARSLDRHHIMNRDDTRARHAPRHHVVRTVEDIDIVERRGVLRPEQRPR